MDIQINDNIINAMNQAIESFNRGDIRKDIGAYVVRSKKKTLREKLTEYEELTNMALDYVEHLTSFDDVANCCGVSRGKLSYALIETGYNVKIRRILRFNKIKEKDNKNKMYAILCMNKALHMI